MCLFYCRRRRRVSLLPRTAFSRFVRSTLPSSTFASHRKQPVTGGNPPPPSPAVLGRRTFAKYVENTRRHSGARENRRRRRVFWYTLEEPHARFASYDEHARPPVDDLIFIELLTRVEKKTHSFAQPWLLLLITFIQCHLFAIDIARHCR